jgi:hypothetical protein
MIRIHNKKPEHILQYLTHIPVVNIALTLGIVGFLSGYLALNTRAATKGFMVYSLEQDIVELEQQHNQLNLDIVSKQSMDNVQKVIAEKGFVPIETMEFITKSNQQIPVATN